MAALLSCYMGIVVVSIWADPIKSFFEGKTTVANTWIKSDASPATIKIVLFLVVVTLVASKADLAVGRDNGVMGPIEVFLYSAITGLLIASTVFSYLPDATQSAIITQTKIVHYLHDYRTLWLLAPIVLIVFVTSRRRNY